jgi:ribonuclease HI
MADTILIWTDGACKGNPGPGGWGATIWKTLQDGSMTHCHDLYGGSAHTTNNIMELTACIEALKSLAGDYIVTLYTDSKYVKEGISLWIWAWRRNGWVTKQNTAVCNKDLWIELFDLAKRYCVKFHWVKGHSDNELNWRADALANIGCEFAKIQDYKLAYSKDDLAQIVFNPAKEMRDSK